MRGTQLRVQTFEMSRGKTCSAADLAPRGSLFRCNITAGNLLIRSSSPAPTEAGAVVSLL